MKKQNIRSKFVKEALVDSYNLSKSLQENTNKIVEEMLKETVKNEFNNLLNEAIDDNEDDEDDLVDDKPEVSDVEDTTETNSSNDEEAHDDIDNADMENETNDDDSSNEDNIDSEVSDDSDDEWSDFDEFKVSDNEYDLTSPEGEEQFAKVYKLLSPNDQIQIVKDSDGKIQIKDTENNTEYLIDMNNDNNTSCDETSCDTSVDENVNENMNIYEVVLNEYDSHVGYTDSYQKQDVMTNDGMKEPAPNKVNDWDKGVPKGTEKPWGNEPKKAEPFSEKVNEEETEEMTDSSDANEETIEEANLSQSRWNDTHAVHNRVPAANKDEFRRNGMQKTSKGTQYRANGGSQEISEQVKKIVSKANEIYKENKELKEALNSFRKLVVEASVVNANLGNVVKLFTRNATTIEEKRSIIDRFGKEAKTIKESNELFEKINDELKNKNVVNENLNIDKQFSTKGSKQLNETTIVKDEGLLKALDLMSRLK